MTKARNAGKARKPLADPARAQCKPNAERSLCSATVKAKQAHGVTVHYQRLERNYLRVLRTQDAMFTGILKAQRRQVE